MRLSDSQIRDTTDLRKHCSHSPRSRPHEIEIVAINRKRHLAARPAEELVKPHLNRLGHFIEISNDGRRDLGNALLYVVFCANLGRPLVFGFQHHIIVRVVGRHGVEDQVGRSRLREHKIDFGKRKERTLDPEVEVF